MTKRPAEPLPDDPARVFAFLAAEAVCETWLAGVKPRELAAVQEEMMTFLRRYRDSQAETLWIAARSHAPGMGDFASQPRPARLAIAAFRDVLNAMDKAFAPEPVKPPPPPALPVLKSALAVKRPMRSIFAKK